MSHGIDFRNLVMVATLDSRSLVRPENEASGPERAGDDDKTWTIWKLRIGHATPKPAINFLISIIMIWKHNSVAILTHNEQELLPVRKPFHSFTLYVRRVSMVYEYNHGWRSSIAKHQLTFRYRRG
jgi:hypothetical protein